jgi:hypothetical protein
MHNQDRLIFLILLPIMAAPFIQPWGLPLTISDMTKEAYAAFAGVPDGGVFFVMAQISWANWFELAPADIAILNQAFDAVRDRGCKVIVVAGSATAEAVVQAYLDEHVDTSGTTYGTDWIWMGWATGGVAAVQGAVFDFVGAIPVDYQGNAVDSYPLIQQLEADNGFVDVDDYSIMYFSYTTIIDYYVRQWGEPCREAGIPLVCITLSGSVPFSLPWYESGIVTAVLNSQKGAAEYEIFSGYLGMAAAFMDCQSGVHLYAVAMLLLGAVFGVYRAFGRSE